MKTILYLLSLVCWLIQQSHAQIGMGGKPHPSAMLDVQAVDKGMYLPRLSSEQRTKIADPQVGLLVFDLDRSAFYFFDGQNWLAMAVTDPSFLPPVSRTVTDGASDDKLGYSVAISGDYAIIGALKDDIGGNIDQGSAYIFVRQGSYWIEQAKLTASDGAGGDFFGVDVSISGDYAVVGAIYDNVNDNSTQGSAYVFTRNGTVWSQQAKLTANDGARGDNFGSSVSISGDYIIVGSDHDTIESTEQGSAYVFNRSGTLWTQQAKLIADDGSSFNNFGNSVCLTGEYAIIGAPGATTMAGIVGAAYIFVRNVFVGSGNTWSLQGKLQADDGVHNDRFGASVTLSGPYAIIGAPQVAMGNDPNPGLNRNYGAAYVFIRQGTLWNQQVRLIASDGAGGRKFGSHVSLSGDYAILGSYSQTGSNPTQNSAYLFQRVDKGWIETRKIVDNAYQSSIDGPAVGISNGTFIIGNSGFRSGQGKVSFGVVE